MEVVMPSSGQVTNTADQMVLNTMKHGMDVMTRLKNTDNGGHYEEQTVYNMDRPSAIIR